MTKDFSAEIKSGKKSESPSLCDKRILFGGAAFVAFFFAWLFFFPTTQLAQQQPTQQTPPQRPPQQKPARKKCWRGAINVMAYSMIP